jgi:YidC/Oxa1 family membrane protein insertase
MSYVFALLQPIGGAAAAIVLLTLLVRLALHPLTGYAVRGERARQRLTPQIAKLRERHGGDPQRFATELAALHRREGVSPFAGILPMLAQAPVFAMIYHLSLGLPGYTLFGVGLGVRLIGASAPQMWIFLLLMAGLAVVAFLAGRRAARVAALLPGPAPSGVLGRLPRLLPFTTVAAAAFLPLATVLYLLTSTTWTLAENILLRRGLPG